MKNGVTTSLLFFVLKMQNIWVGRMTVNGERKRGWPKLVPCLTKFVDTLLQPISKSQKSYLSLKRQMWKTEHFLFRWTLWVLTQIYSKTRVYWNLWRWGAPPPKPGTGALIWDSPIALTLTQIAKVIWERDVRILRGLGMRLPIVTVTPVNGI